MVTVDISNIWGVLALPELLGIEQAVSAAHMGLDGSAFRPCTSGELLRLIAVAEGLRQGSQVCVVLGKDNACLAAKAVVELLQGRERNLTRGQTGDPRLFFAGDSFSSRRWEALRQQLDGKDFSVIAVSGEDLAPETGAALRNLKWMLDRRYGTEESSRRICAVTHPENGPLAEMARLHSWELIPMEDAGGFDALSPAALMILAAAGLDAAGYLAGAAEVREDLELRSFENPLWLYAAVQRLLLSRGAAAECLAAWEPDFAAFGQWWQQCYLPAGIPVIPGNPSRPGTLVTAVRFDPSDVRYEIPSDVHDTDGLNTLAGKTLEEVRENAFPEAVDAWTEENMAVLTMDCGPLEEASLGSLVYFLSLGSALAAGLGADSGCGE